jgi:retron-type reverse transcriptase
MHEKLMEEVLSQANATIAWRAVVRNQGAAGMDGMTTSQLKDHIRQHWGTIRAKLLDGTYVPSPVRRTEIPKPREGFGGWGYPRSWIDGFSKCSCRS